MYVMCNIIDDTINECTLFNVMVNDYIIIMEQGT